MAMAVTTHSSEEAVMGSVSNIQIKGKIGEPEPSCFFPHPAPLTFLVPMSLFLSPDFVKSIWSYSK